MYEVTESRRKLHDGTEITTYTRDVVSANILQAEAGTTGFHGRRHRPRRAHLFPHSGSGQHGHRHQADRHPVRLRRLRGHPRRRLRAGDHDPGAEVHHQGARRRIEGGVRLMFTLYSADFTGNPGNCSYPHKTAILDADSLKAAVCHDYVCAEYKNHYRNGDNFLSADCLPVDCDNDHSEDPADWIRPSDVLPGVSGSQPRHPLQPLQRPREERQARKAEVPRALSHRPRDGLSPLRRHEEAGQHHLPVLRHERAGCRTLLLRDEGRGRGALSRSHEPHGVPERRRVRRRASRRPREGRRHPGGQPQRHHVPLRRDRHQEVRRHGEGLPELPREGRELRPAARGQRALHHMAQRPALLPRSAARPGTSRRRSTTTRTATSRTTSPTSVRPRCWRGTSQTSCATHRPRTSSATATTTGRRPSPALRRSPTSSPAGSSPSPQGS